ncbi:MAG TPA: hypothetical protein VIJ93_08870 [bacterium]
MIWLEIVVSCIMGFIGGYLMLRGKKIQEPKMILWGAALIVLSYLLFAGWGKDDDSKELLKKLMPPTPTEQQLQQQP